MDFGLNCVFFHYYCWALRVNPLTQKLQRLASCPLVERSTLTEKTVKTLMSPLTYGSAQIEAQSVNPKLNVAKTE
jgi:hypothetical protein